MLKRLEVFLIAGLFILITAIILIIYTKQREQEFNKHQAIIQKSSVHGAAHAINLHLLDKQRHIRVFADEYTKHLSHLATFPADMKSAQDIKIRLRDRFSDFYTFTIANPNGIPLLEDFDAEVGEVCQLDVNKFIKNVQGKKNSARNNIFIHPQPFNYHYDVMVPLHFSRSPAHVFFTSFYPLEISKILQTHEVPGQQLMLVSQADSALIEVTAKGTRDKLNREFRLTDDEQRRVKVTEDISGTNWRLVDLPNEDYEKQYRHNLWKEAIVILLIVGLALTLLILVLVKFPRNKAQD